jgi:hypothetical protein
MTEENIKQSDLRRVQVLSRAALGTPTRQIAKELGLTEGCVSRTIKLPEAQEHLAQVISSLSDQLDTRLPPLLIKALDTIEKILDSRFADQSTRLRAADSILKVATRLAEITARSNHNN